MPPHARSVDPVMGHPAHYHEGKTNLCPECGGSQWMVGRIMAECALCETAMPLLETHHRQSFPWTTRGLT
jgi:hypothetical protein